ncbi:MAG: serine/threonine protein kinase [Planctomycetota bacterium]|jgi:serine/threonine-protein kinase|nr:serine/threonine protein kinase [Planctomycetota bacterium]
MSREVARDGPFPSAATDTADFGGKPPPLFREAPNLEDLLNHLEDANPSVIADSSEDGFPPARYLIGQELGSGSIGQVIEAWDRHLNRKVAIKILREGEGLSREGIARFIAEAQITAQLEHPSVVPVHEIGLMPGGMPYFSMKLVKGRSLDEIINHLRVSDPEVRRSYSRLARLRLFQRISQGMAYAHAKGVAHLDLKPANIWIGEYGEVQIMDWGLAKLLPIESPENGGERVLAMRQDSETGTADGSLAGTPAYMSPEQARGEYSRLGPESDVFSLGLILAELMSLSRVYRQIGFQATLEAARRPAGEVDIHQLNPGLSFNPSLDRIVRRATHPDPGRRYPHAGELSSSLAGLIEEQFAPGSLKRLPAPGAEAAGRVPAAAARQGTESRP